MAGTPLAGNDPYLAGRPCPNCAYVRTAADANPAWQCPRCHIAYVKFEPPPAPVHRRVAAEAREMALEAGSDYSFYVLIASNVLALVIGAASGMGLREMMIVYWIQSVIIGITHFVRILVIRQFNTDGVAFSGRPMQENTGDKLKIALFFAVHYGFFHAVMLGLLLHGHRPGAGGSALGYALCALVFLANHLYSLLHNVQRDARGRPHIMLLMFLPYARIVPMHVTIVLGQGQYASAEMFSLFGGLKTAADVVMHTIEHHVLTWSGQRPKEPSP